MSKQSEKPDSPVKVGSEISRETPAEGHSPKRYEWTVLLLGAFWFFFLLFGYYILRPIREQIGATYGVRNLSWLFAATFGVNLVAIPLFSYLVGKYDRKKLVPAIYLFFVSNLILFWVGMKYGSAASQIWIARALFVWVSVYGLFIVSFFWSVIGDMLSTGQGRRLFGYMAGGGTVGGMIGSQVAALSVEHIGVANLLFFPIALLIAGLVVYYFLEKQTSLFGENDRVDSEAKGKATGGNPFAGFTAVFESRYLLAICVYGVLMATCSTSVYFQQSEIVNANYSSLAELDAEAAKTKYFANINFAVSIVTLVVQLAVVGLLMKWAGLGIALAVLPVIYLVAVTCLGIWPTIEVLAVITVIGRAFEYGVMNPAREVLFTSVNREDRYKAKSFIDTVVRRGGDTGVGSLYKWLRESAGFAMTTLSWIIVPVALAWAGLALFIGRENRRIVAKGDGEADVGG